MIMAVPVEAMDAVDITEIVYIFNLSAKLE